MNTFVCLSPYQGVLYFQTTEEAVLPYLETKQVIPYQQGYLIVNPDRAREIIDGLNNLVPVKIVPEAMELVKRLTDESVFETPSLILPEGFIPKRFQNRCLNKLSQEARNMVILSTGTGKSFVGTALASYWLDNGFVDRVIVWCPVALIKDWVKNIQRFTTLTVETPNTSLSAEKRAEFYLTSEAQVWVLNYERVRVVDFEAIEKSMRKRKVGFVEDEISKLRNRSSQTYKRFAKLAKNTACQTGLTATPIVRGPENYYNEWRILNPSIFGLVRDFERDYTLNNGEKDTWGRYIGYQNLPYLSIKTAAQTFVADKKHPEIACEFPAQHEIALTVELSPQERKLYDEIMDYGESLPVEIRKAPLFVFMLRRLCDCPEIMLKRTPDGYDENYNLQKAEIFRICEKYKNVLEQSKNSNKLALLIEKAEELLESGEKVIIFGTYTHNCLFPVGKHLEKHNPLFYTGSTPNREDNIKLFKQSSEHNLLLMSDAGGLGLNLPECHNVIHVQTPYTYTDYIQRSSRVHRIDSDAEFVTIYRFVTENTIEERIEDTMQSRREMSEDVGIMDMEKYEELGLELDLNEDDASFLLGWGY